MCGSRNKVLPLRAPEVSPSYRKRPPTIPPVQASTAAPYPIPPPPTPPPQQHVPQADRPLHGPQAPRTEHAHQFQRSSSAIYETQGLEHHTHAVQAPLNYPSMKSDKMPAQRVYPWLLVASLSSPGSQESLMGLMRSSSNITTRSSVEATHAVRPMRSPLEVAHAARSKRSFMDATQKQCAVNYAYAVPAPRSMPASLEAAHAVHAARCIRSPLLSVGSEREPIAARFANLTVRIPGRPSISQDETAPSRTRRPPGHKEMNYEEAQMVSSIPSAAFNSTQNTQSASGSDRSAKTGIPCSYQALPQPRAQQLPAARAARSFVLSTSIHPTAPLTWREDMDPYKHHNELLNRTSVMPELPTSTTYRAHINGATSDMHGWQGQGGCFGQGFQEPATASRNAAGSQNVLVPHDELGTILSRQNTETLMEGDVSHRVGRANLRSGFSTSTESSASSTFLRPNEPTSHDLEDLGASPPTTWGIADNGKLPVSNVSPSTKTLTPHTAHPQTPLTVDQSVNSHMHSDAEVTRRHIDFTRVKRGQQDTACMLREELGNLQLTWSPGVSSSIRANPLRRKGGSDSICVPISTRSTLDRMHVHRYSRMHVSQPLADGDGDTFTRIV